MVACPAWLSVGWLLDQFGSEKRQREDRYVQFVADGVSANVWESLNQQVYLGSDEFVEGVKQELSGARKLSEVPRVQWQPSGKNLSEYASLYDNRGEAMARAYLEGNYRMNEIVN